MAAILLYGTCSFGGHFLRPALEEVAGSGLFYLPYRSLPGRKILLDLIQHLRIHAILIIGYQTSLVSALGYSSQSSRHGLESLNLNLLQVEEKSEGVSLMINRYATVLIKNTRICQVYASRTAELKHDPGLKKNKRLVLCYGLLG